jgi:hypothetical protein
MVWLCFEIFALKEYMEEMKGRIPQQVGSSWEQEWCYL